ncbi:unnamed protein product, partial [marine sediment metagenome]
MGTWNTYSFSNDHVWDSFGSACTEKELEVEGDFKGTCNVVKGGTTLF